MKLHTFKMPKAISSFISIKNHNLDRISQSEYKCDEYVQFTYTDFIIVINQFIFLNSLMTTIFINKRKSYFGLILRIHVKRIDTDKLYYNRHLSC